MTKFLVFFGLILGSQVAFAQTYTRVQCLSQGTSVGGNDMGPFTSDSRLSFTIEKSADGTSHSLRGEGVIMVAQAFEKVASPALLNPDNSYIAMFDVNLKENLAYRPIVYKGYSQFKDFDADQTVGHESGMWGYFLIEKTYLADDNFTGVYVFQAGDHLGGTLFFGCKKSG